jgi:hypothetical protein
MRVGFTERALALARLALTPPLKDPHESKTRSITYDPLKPFALAP